ncbi:hypothetical protein PIB30_028060 [Stylosanthes scabra]|uniref:Uncharacterized protein n=1 Tax=Stylosanthes scabra TaxID=79078 RepID=A0ABU6RB76_9FABA|nr:hypothetical protein [Stylosanthes scabra]
MAHIARNEFAEAEASGLDHIRGLIATTRGGNFILEGANGDRHWSMNPNDQMILIDIPSHHAIIILFVPDSDWSVVVVWRSHMTSLRQLCNTLRLPLPGFLKQTEDGMAKGTVHRFLVTLPPGPNVDVLSAAGRNSNDEVIAREDAAAAMIRKIIQEIGYVIHDYNHERAETLQRSNSSHYSDLDRMRHRNHKLMVEFMEFRELYAPTYNSLTSSESSD